MNSAKPKIYGRHYWDSILIHAGAAEVFAYIDDHARFSSHMNESSWMMGGGRMNITTDAGRGQKTGSHIRMSGKVFGIGIILDEVVTDREPPHMKAWETVGTPRLIVIGSYRMKIIIEPKKPGSLLRVSLEYDLPASNAWLGRLFGGAYAKWCVKQMINGVRNYFNIQKP